MTNLYAFGAILAGRFPWGASTLTFPIALALLALALPSALSRNLRPASGAALAVSALALLGLEADVAGNADLPMVLFEILAVALLLGPPGNEADRQLLAGLLLAGASTAKVEGLVFTLTVVLVVLLRPGLRGSRVRSLALLIGPTALALGAWFLLGLSRGFLRTYGEYGSLLDSQWPRAGAVVGELFRAFAADGWALPFLVPLAVLLWSAREGVHPLPSPRLGSAEPVPRCDLSAPRRRPGPVDPLVGRPDVLARRRAPRDRRRRMARRPGEHEDRREGRQGGDPPPEHEGARPVDHHGPVDAGRTSNARNARLYRRSCASRPSRKRRHPGQAVVEVATTVFRAASTASSIRCGV